MYVELHAHSNFSLLDGASTVEELIEAAHGAGMTALALSVHNGLYAAPQFFRTAKEAGIKPIIGAELKLEGSSHITLLDKERADYTNLSRLITKAQLAGSKGDPRLTFADLAEQSKGLICLSGCSKGEVSSLMLKGKKDWPSNVCWTLNHCSRLRPSRWVSPTLTITVDKGLTYQNGKWYSPTPNKITTVHFNNLGEPHAALDKGEGLLSRIQVPCEGTALDGPSSVGPRDSDPSLQPHLRLLQ